MIAEGHFDNLDDCDEEVNTYLENGGKEELCTVVGAYVTFQTEDGYKEAVHYMT
jgi:hypothetical protein